MNTLTLTQSEKTLTAKVATWDGFESQTYTASDIKQIILNRDIVVIELVEGGCIPIDRATFKQRIRREKFKQEVRELTALNTHQSELVKACVCSFYHGTVNLRSCTATLTLDNEQVFTRIWFDDGKREAPYNDVEPGWRNSYSCPMKDALSSPQEAIAAASEGFEVTVRRYLQNELYAFHYLDEDIQESIKAAAQRVLEQPIF